jgi:AmmeMemoRadiSam system protein B
MKQEDKAMKAQTIRAPAVSGMFYPASAYELQSDVEKYLARARLPRPAPRPKALIAPHAGYDYSGPIAGSAFACLRDMHRDIARVLLIGPSHRVAFRGLALSSADAFNTPLGEVSIDQEANGVLLSLDAVNMNDRAHRDEHCLEVELPFLQCTLDDFFIIPVVVGDADAQQVAEVIEKLWGGPETLIVVSSDLSHYFPYVQAQAMDRNTAMAILELAPEKISPEQACGRLAIQGLLIAAKNHQRQPVQLDLRNSGDTAGDKSEVVGYGAWVF